jgi:hypothetical protein
VANSVDARVGVNPVEVEITLKQEEIWIVDSGIGMDFATLRKAVRLAVKLLLGEAGRELLLASQKVIPSALQEAGFSFSDTSIEQAIAQVIAVSKA